MSAVLLMLGIALVSGWLGFRGYEALDTHAPLTEDEDE